MTVETLGAHHPDTLIATGNMADLLRECGELSEAAETMGAAPEVARQELGADHLDTILLEAKAARVQHALAPNESAGAEALRRVVAQLEKKMGSDHPQARKYRLALSEIEAADIE